MPVESSRGNNQGAVESLGGKSKIGISPAVLGSFATQIGKGNDPIQAESELLRRLNSAVPSRRGVIEIDRKRKNRGVPRIAFDDEASGVQYQFEKRDDGIAVLVNLVKMKNGKLRY